MPEAVIDSTEISTPVAPVRKDPFDDNSWTEKRPESKQVQDVPRGTIQQSIDNRPNSDSIAPIIAAAPSDMVDVKGFIKNEFGWEDPEIGKKELAELRELRNKPIKFDNEESERIYNHIKSGNKAEIKKYLDREERLSSLDSLKPEDVIKMQIHESNPHYTSQDVQDIFEDKYSLPEKPESGGDDTDPIYLANLDKWQKQVDKITRSIGRDSFSAKETLAKLKTELVLPDIHRADPDAAAKAQGLVRAQAALRSSYEEAFNRDFGSFAGYNVEAISGEVKLPINYGILPEENDVLKTKMFDFDVSDYFDKRWFPEGKPNIPLMKKELYALENFDKILQKTANDAASKAVDNHLKNLANIKVDDQTQNQNQGNFANADNKEVRHQKAIQKMWEEA